MATQTRTLETREKILTATIEVVHQQGVTALTLDLVAKYASVSKGGLLHHFPSKDALIEALLTHLITQFENAVRQFYESEAVGRGRWLRAYIHASFAETLIPIELIPLFALTLNASNPLGVLLQAEQTQWMTRFTAEGVSVARATILKAAADTYWLDRVIGLDAPNRDELRAELLHLIDTP